MRNYLYVFFAFLLVASCDDGDVIEVELDFENTFKSCGELVFYKTKTDPGESLSIFINDLTIDQIVEFEYIDTDSVLVELTSASIVRMLDGTTNKLNYRTYSNLPTTPFCSDVPASNLNITNDSEGTGSVAITTTLVEDDNDGISAELEVNDDTDGDGVPNYLDEDDDGDNVYTINEDINNNDDLTDDDTDGDGVPNYLDNDDDGDGVLTRDEQSFSQDQNPANDVTNTQVGPDYLNSEVAISTPETSFRTHTIQQTFVVTLVITDLSIPQLSQDVLNFGTLDDPSITISEREVKTIFN